MVITTINPSEIVVMFTNLAILGAPHWRIWGLFLAKLRQLRAKHVPCSEKNGTTNKSSPKSMI